MDWALIVASLVGLTILIPRLLVPRTKRKDGMLPCCVTLEDRVQWNKRNLVDYRHSLRLPRAARESREDITADQTVYMSELELALHQACNEFELHLRSHDAID